MSCDNTDGAEPAILPFGITFATLYAIAALVLAWRIGSRPAFAYNWESYTARGVIDFVHQPTRDVLQMNEGLMTDSGRSAVVVGPAWLGFEIFGQGFFALRLPIILISALAVPLTWLLGRRLYSDPVGLAAAGLVITSQVFLLYGRTATVVGMSIGPAIVGFLLLWMCVRRNGDTWMWWLPALQAALIINSYWYSPIRFLWPIACVLFAVEIVLRRGERTRFVLSLVTTIVVLPLAITFLRPGPIDSPVDAVEAYYNGRGEQIFKMNDSPSGFVPFIRTDSDEERQRIAEESRSDQAWLLVRQNAENLANLLIDRRTLPAITDFWNPHGRLYPKPLVPFFLAGTVILVIGFFREPRSRFLLALFWGYSLPMLLTTQVHIGRLVYTVPLLGLICALPIARLARWLANRQPLETRSVIQRWGAFALAGLLVLGGGAPSLADWKTDFPPQSMPKVADQIVALTAEPPSQRVVYVFGDLGGYEIESLRVAELEMLLPGYLRFRDLTTGEERGAGAIPLLYGAVIPLLNQPGMIPGYCDNLYLVDANAVDRFHAASDAVARETCGRLLRFETAAY